MAFHFLRQDLFGDATALEIVGHTELSARFHWVDGRPFEVPFPRETFTLDDAGGTSWPDFFDTTVPVMSSRLLAELRACGATNLEAYPVVLANPRDGVQRDDYCAVNVVGRVDAVDWSSTAHEVRGRKRITGAVAIDAQLAGDLRAFRLPYSPRFIVVAHGVAEHLRSCALSSVLLQPTTAYAGV